MGNIYLDDPANPLTRTWNPVLGATLQLYSGDGTQALADPVPADQLEGFAIVTEGYGEYRVLLTLPKNARFVDSESNDAKPLDGEPYKAWLTYQGSEVLALQKDDPPITCLYVAVYYPANLTGRIASANGGNLGGVTIDLLDDEDNIIATTVTGQDGSYAFNNPTVVREGDYRVEARFPLANNLEAIGDMPLYLIPGASQTIPPIPVAQREDIILG